MNPGQLPGAVVAARSLAAHLRTMAAGFEAAAGALPQMNGGWSGVAARAAGMMLHLRPALFREVAAGCREAATALAVHAEALEHAAAAHDRSRTAPEEVRVAVEQRATEAAAESAVRTAHRLIVLAESAPRPPNRLRRWWNRLDELHAEVTLGAAEAGQALVATTAQLAVRLVAPPDDTELLQTARMLRTAAGNPTEVAKALVDWDTWRSNPARAVGHLTPDLLAALASGGAAAGARSVTITHRTEAALRVATGRAMWNRQMLSARASGSRDALVHNVFEDADARLAGTDPPGRWNGEGGTRLSARDRARADMFHALVAAHEPAVTATMEAAARAAGGRLAGLEHRLKEPESFRRKLATLGPGSPSPSEVLPEVHDLLRYTVVLDEQRYVAGLLGTASRLESAGFLATAPRNSWGSARYRGVNTSWLDPRTGVSFEVQFHTPASRSATVETHPLYDELRLPDTTPERRVELDAAIAARFREAPLPGWVRTVDARSYPPVQADPVEVPLSLALPVAAGSAGASHCLVGTDRFLSGRGGHEPQRGVPQHQGRPRTP